jgi:hypothetical protein
MVFFFLFIFCFQSLDNQIVVPAPASTIFSQLPTSQAIEEDYEIPPDWKVPKSVGKVFFYYFCYLNI